MDISGTNLTVKYVKSTEECAKICSQTKSCDSFWCYSYGPSIVSGGVTKSCHLKRNGKYRKADHKTAGICSKGRFSYSDSIHQTCSFSDAKAHFETSYKKTSNKTNIKGEWETSVQSFETKGCRQGKEGVIYFDINPDITGCTFSSDCIFYNP